MKACVDGGVREGRKGKTQKRGAQAMFLTKINKDLGKRGGSYDDTHTAR
jgi:hypothetical protein